MAKSSNKKIIKFLKGIALTLGIIAIILLIIAIAQNFI